MDLGSSCRCRSARAGFAVILTALLGACAPQTVPAPVFQRGAVEPVSGPSSTPPPALRVIVKRGQTLDGYAYTYHIPKSAIIAANGLRPPYELKTGMQIAIPATGRPVGEMAMRPAAANPMMPPRTAAFAPPTPQPPAHPETLSPPGAVLQAATAPPARPQPDVIPLDGPAPARETAAAAPQPGPQTLSPPRPATPTPPQAAAPSSAQTGADTVGRRLPWPVRGRVLANYGSTPGGGHNDGINIAAPMGAPVHAIDGGTVAYVGNEVKGYGNTVLIRHSNGWISAYAHLSDVTVKPGQTIAVGQVIARVGESGGVSEPQLHFELRRGKTPVDPKEFLAPAPSAAASGAGGAG